MGRAKVSVVGRIDAFENFEYAETIRLDRESSCLSDYQLRQFADRVVTESGLRDPYGSPNREVKVLIFVPGVHNKRFSWKSLAQLPVTVPKGPMSSEQFNKARDEILDEVPFEFHDGLCYQAYEKGHGSGYEEVLIHLRDYVAMINGPLQKYRERILKEKAGKAKTS